MIAPARLRRRSSALLTTVFALALASSAGAGTALGGRDRARILPPSGAVVTPYENAGYRLRLDDDEAWVEVDLSPLESRVPFRPPATAPPAAIGRLAYALTRGEHTRYGATSRVLGWLARDVEYALDRAEPQDPLAVLERRRGYCTGVARLAVTMLAAVGIPAREVAGYVVDEGTGTGAYHRWIEVYFDDRGWVFSDPLASHHHVDARYLRLADERLDESAGLGGLLVERHDRRQAVDVYPGAPRSVAARRNHGRRMAAAVAVRLAEALPGTAVLEGGALRRRQPLRAGGATFVGLDPGRYILRLELAGRPSGETIERTVELSGHIRADLYLPTHALDPRRETSKPREPKKEGPR